MSELKVYKILGIEFDSQFYHKAEADKVFRRLKTRLAHKGISNQRLEADKNNNWRKYCAVMAELRHSNRKRCLAMARWCAAECVVNQDTYRRHLTHKSEFRIGHLRKWYKRWLELAEKFKEAE